MWTRKGVTASNIINSFFRLHKYSAKNLKKIGQRAYYVEGQGVDLATGGKDHLQIKGPASQAQTEPSERLLWEALCQGEVA